MKRKTLYIIVAILVLAAVTTTLVIVFKKKDVPQTTEIEEEKIPEKYGIPIEGWDLITDTVRKGDYLGTILSKYGITAQQIDKIGRMSTDSFNTTLINVGNLYTVFSDTTIDGIPQAKIFIYENSNVKFTKYDFRNPDTIIIEKLRKPVDTVSLEAAGVIEYSLWQTMIDNGYNWELALAMSQTFAWTVDFYSLQKGNWFKVIYTEYFVDDKQIGLGEVKAGVFYHGGKELWAIPFMQDSVTCFYDTLGNSMRKTFLLAPLEYTHISSRYSYARMHPIWHTVGEHLAVDFSAPSGTPVYAASDGTITTRTFQSGAGNYVVIRHNSVYSTVYMHFSKFGEYNVGDRVNQGDIIGYVGSTGWSTGPHLHYEVHENGKKIDPLTFEPPPAEPVDSAHMERFNKEKRKWIDQINKIKMPVAKKK
ncbi:MAG: peptidoglycan DD-metalloendopeptidase family protein [Bacteroidales bacterium]|nr:peptidoglycan DD-metalloendopeptidase family protein [Bacteroidales bacterium]